MTRAMTCSPPTASAVISSMAFTTCAAVITLPSAATSTPEPVSLKRVTPRLLTSRPFARITTTEGLTLLKSSLRFWACATGPTTCSTAMPSTAARSLFMELRRPVVRKLQGDAQVFRFHESDDGLEIVAVLARHADLILLDRRLDPDLGVLDEAHDLLGLVHGNAVLERDALAQGSPRRGLRILDGERLQVDAAPVELGLEDVEDGLELHVVGGGEDEVHLLLGDLVLGPLEVVAGLDLPLGLVDGVGDLLHVELARDVEAVLGGHGLLPRL